MAPTMPTTPTEPTTPMPMPVAVSVTDFAYLSGDNVPTAGTHEIAAGETATSGGVTYLCAEGGDACTVTIADDGTAEDTGGTVTASLTADAMTQVAEAKEMKSDEMLAMRDRVIGQDAALEGVENLAATSSATALGEDGIRVTRAAGAAARVRVGTTATVTAVPDGYSPSGDAAMANGDWAGTHLTRSVGSATQHLVVYTDIEPPTRVQFYNFDGKATTPHRYDQTTVTRAFTPDTDIPALALTGSLFSRGVLDPAKFNAPGPAGDGATSQRFVGSANGIDASTAGLRFKGNYNGAPGTYACTSGTTTGATAGDCVVTIPETGPYTAATGDTWTFTPELNATAWRNDTEFMHFGWWLHEPSSANGAYSFQYYANGTPFMATATLPSGTATYAGRAAGRYAVQTVEDGGVTGGMVGQFTAAASLTANFDAVTGTGTAAPTIQGTINGFQSDQQHDISGWEVTLHRNAFALTASTVGPTDLAAQTQLDPGRPSYYGVTATMGDQTAYGDWTAQFFGNKKTAGGSDVDSAQPLGVGGTFQADNDEASIAGAFGARR